MLKCEGAICCRICGAVLCDTADLIVDEVNTDPSCGSYFLDSPIDWMEEAASSTEGKLSCPECAGKVGRISWIGFEAIHGRWISPAIMITKSRSDLKWRNRVKIEPLGFDNAAPNEGVDDLESIEETDNFNKLSISKQFIQVDIYAEVSEFVDFVISQVCDAVIPNKELTTNPSENSDPAASLTESNLEGTVEVQNGPDILSKKSFSKAELATMDMLDLVKLLDNGLIEMEDLVEACDEAAAQKKEEMKKNRDLKDPQVLMSAIKEEIGSDEIWKKLRVESGRLSKNELSCSDYYDMFQVTFELLDQEGLFTPLVDTLRDGDKRSEIHKLHNERHL